MGLKSCRRQRGRELQPSLCPSTHLPVALQLAGGAGWVGSGSEETQYMLLILGTVMWVFWGQVFIPHDAWPFSCPAGRHMSARHLEVHSQSSIYEPPIIQVLYLVLVRDVRQILDVYFILRKERP